jgi:mono/diheme cytochrome c family protein
MREWKDLGLPTVLASPLPDNDKGQTLYSAHCAACHQGDGAGLTGHFPSLRGDEVVVAPDGSTLARAILYGVQGLEIKGERYTAKMPAFPKLTNEEIAAIATHVRTRWGNHASPLTAADVARVRAEDYRLRKNAHASPRR